MSEESTQPVGTGIRTELYEIFERYGWLGRDIIRATELLEHMAATQLIERFEGKLESQNAILEAQNTKFNLLLWFIGVGVTALVAVGLFVADRLIG